MTDLEVTQLCATAMNIRTWSEGGMEIMTGLVSTGIRYDPLHNDVQAMALVKTLRLNIGCTFDGLWFADEQGREAVQTNGENLNRAICECVAKMQAAKT